jgi:hypothetical protein
MASSDWLIAERGWKMATPLERVQAAWATGDPLALHRETEKLAAEGQPRQALEDALEALLDKVRTAGADDDTEEIINGVWDRLTGWCHPGRHIRTGSSMDKGRGVDSKVIDDQKTLDSIPNPSTLP